MTQMRTRFSANTMCQLFLQIYKDCGLKGATSHSGRRTYITKLANAGINVRLLAELAGSQAHQHHPTLHRCKRHTVGTRCGAAVMGNKRVLALRKQLKREQLHVQWLEQHLPQLTSAQQRTAASRTAVCTEMLLVESAALPTTQCRNKKERRRSAALSLT